RREPRSRSRSSRDYTAFAGVRSRTIGVPLCGARLPSDRCAWERCTRITGVKGGPATIGGNTMAAEINGLLLRGIRLLLLLISVGFLSHHALAVPDRLAPEEPAKVQVFVTVPAGVQSFVNRQLEVVLYEYDPHAPGQESLIARHVNKVFRHNRGVETNSL